MMTECGSGTAALHNIGNVCQAEPTGKGASDLGAVVGLPHSIICAMFAKLSSLAVAQ